MFTRFLLCPYRPGLIWVHPISRQPVSILKWYFHAFAKVFCQAGAIPGPPSKRGSPPRHTCPAGCLRSLPWPTFAKRKAPPDPAFVGNPWGQWNGNCPRQTAPHAAAGRHPSLWGRGGICDAGTEHIRSKIVVFHVDVGRALAKKNDT